MNNKKFTVLLVQSMVNPIADLENILLQQGDKLPKFTYPMPSLCLASMLQEQTSAVVSILDLAKSVHEYVQMEHAQPIGIREYLEQFLQSSGVTPDVVGVSVQASMGYSVSLLICSVVRTIWPGAITILGGVHPTSCPGPAIADTNVDYVLRGAGEISFVQMISRLQAGQSLDCIPGLVHDPMNIATMSPPVENLDSLPLPAYDLIDFDYYARNQTWTLSDSNVSRTGMIQTSRGCTFNCSFCAGKLVHGKKIHFKSIGRILEELHLLVDEYSVDTIVICDELFGANKKRFFELFKHIDDQGMNLHFTFPYGVSVALFDEEMLDCLIEHGVDSIAFAIESGNKHVLKHIVGKGVELEKARHLVSHCRERKVWTTAFFILGFPGEDKEMMRTSIEFARDLETDWNYFYIAYPLPGTRMCQQLLEKGIITWDKLFNMFERHDFGGRSYDSPEISATEMNTLAYDANIEVNFFENWNMWHGYLDRALRGFDQVLGSYPFHIPALACKSACLHLLGSHSEKSRALDEMKQQINESATARELYDRYIDRISHLFARAGIAEN